MEELLSVKEASEIVKLKPGTLYAMAEKKEIPHTKLGRRLFFQRSALEEWVRERTFTPAKKRKKPEGIYSEPPDGAGV